MKPFIYNNHTIYITKKNIKRLYLRVKPPNADIFISAPKSCTKKEILKFISQSSSFISEQATKILEDNAHTLARGEKLKDIQVFNNRFMYEIIQINQTGKEKKVKDYLEFSNNIFYIYLNDIDDNVKLTSLIELYYINILKEKIAHYINQYETRMNVHCMGTKIRKMSSRWGSCNTTKATITFNFNLIYKDERFLEYVVVHELAHLIEANHSSAFYKILDDILPEHRKMARY